MISPCSVEQGYNNTNLLKSSSGFIVFVKRFFMSAIGDRMRALRGASSLREMADAIGIKYSAWARYESGDVLPGAEIISKICRVHACSADWLLGLDERGTSVNAGAGAAVAIGANARASARTSVAPPGDAPICAKCPHLKKLQKLEALISK